MNSFGWDWSLQIRFLKGWRIGSGSDPMIGICSDASSINKDYEDCIQKKYLTKKSSRKMNISEKKVFWGIWSKTKTYYARSLNKMTQATKFKLPYSP